jgi:hypothetical protein
MLVVPFPFRGKFYRMGTMIKYKIKKDRQGNMQGYRVYERWWFVFWCKSRWFPYKESAEWYVEQCQEYDRRQAGTSSWPFE